MKLTSMTDKVLEFESYYPCSDVKDYKETNEVVLRKIINYAHFLKQPLKLEYFVACDEDGNVLEDPEDRVDYTSTEMMEEAELEYQQAKEKVLFEGFEMTDLNDSYQSIKLIDVDFNVFWNNKIEGWKLSHGIFTIEDLVKYNITLTPNAIKKFNL